MAGVQLAAERELGTRRRGDSSSSSSSTSRELLLGVACSLPAPLAELVEQLLAEGEEAAAVSVAVTASTRLRSRARRRGPEPEVRLGCQIRGLRALLVAQALRRAQPIPELWCWSGMLTGWPGFTVVVPRAGGGRPSVAYSLMPAAGRA
jgi:hypothetical protein